jgi:hypothetical protein
MADEIEEIYLTFAHKKDQIAADSRKLEYAHRFDLEPQLRWAAEDAVREYGSRYQSDAMAYRREMIVRLGPGAHDTRTDYVFSSVWGSPALGSAYNLPVIANELRRLAGQLRP